MYRKSVLLASALVGAASAQQVGTYQAETHPSITTYKCTKAGGCVSQAQQVVLDANWRWVHKVGDYTNCYTGNAWNTALCPDPVTCAQGCAVEGADYSGTYGITTSGNGLTLKFITKSSTGSANIGSRVYLMSSDSSYQMFNLKNQEFTFDVDVSGLGCGLNGALYLVEMDQDGGLAKYPNNKAGAKYGTGYCDTQCPHDMKFINGEANSLDWTPSSNDVNAGSGRYGTCCNEMDIWEANSISAALTPHVCSVSGQTRCSGVECGDGADRYNGICDKDGCDFNSYRMGNTSFYGPAKTIDTTKKVTVVTQFITNDNTATGTLVEIRRKYVQNGIVYANSFSNIAGITSSNSITDAFCKNQKTIFGDTNTFSSLGGLAAMGDSLANGMVLALSLWDDHSANMLWLDSTYPTDSTKPGAARGSCATTSGNPTDVEANQASSSVTYSNIRWGELDSTYSGTAAGGGSAPVSSSTLSTKAATSTKAASSSTKAATSSTKAATSSTPVVSKTSSAAGSASSAVPKWGQCGGTGYTGSKVCVAGTTCTVSSEWYSQCL